MDPPREAASRKAPAEEPFVLAAMLSLLGACLWMALRPELLLQFFYSPEHLALTHLVTLGFLTSLIMGVLLRVAPEALGVAPRSRRLALAQCGLFLLGASGMVTHFALGDWIGLASAAPLVLLAALLQAFNFREVYARAARGDIVALHVAASLTHLVLAASLGLAYGSLRAWGVGFGTQNITLLARLGAHLLLAAGGWVGSMILGLQLRLLPGASAPRPLLLLRFGLYQGGLLAGVVCLLGGLPTGLPWALGALVLAVALQLAGPLAHLPRRPDQAGDVAALLLLLLAGLAALAEALDWPADSGLRLRLLHATGYAVLVGFGPLTVAATSARLFPRWVRDERFGDGPAPPPSALFSPRLRDAAVAALGLGVLLAATGIVAEDESLASAGAWIVAAGATLFAASFAYTARWAFLRRERAD